jgi:hypothetical protein
MIKSDMRLYNYFTIGDKNEYGQATIPDTNGTPEGQVKMAIYISSQNVQDNINYRDCNYIGLTKAAIDDSYIIKYGKEDLKVLYINPKGTYKQVFLKGM